MFFSSSIASKFADLRRDRFLAGKRGSSGLSPARLTPRENEVLQLVAEGRATKQIADDLSISAKTVEKHRQQVMNKLNIHQIAGLTRYAVDRGIIQVGVAAMVMEGQASSRA
jgi:DNA-binding NarL/FixJ family response regulator